MCKKGVDWLVGEHAPALRIESRCSRLTACHVMPWVYRDIPGLASKSLQLLDPPPDLCGWASAIPGAAKNRLAATLYNVEINGVEASGQIQMLRSTRRDWKHVTITLGYPFTGTS